MNELEKAKRLNEVYEWLFMHNLCVGLEDTMREDGRRWVVYNQDQDGEVVARGRDCEEAAWAAWDLAHHGEE